MATIDINKVADEILQYEPEFTLEQEEIFKRINCK